LLTEPLIGLIVQHAAAHLQGGLPRRADDIVAICWRALS
jgi:hypothetical protein